MLTLSSHRGDSRTIKIAELGNGFRRYVHGFEVFRGLC
jgi:hypothetical protein